MADETSEAPASVEKKPGRMTLRLKADCLRLDVLAKTLTHWLGGLNAVERELTGARRARCVWRIVELTWDGAECRVTIES